jgi:putative N6-adenine-specific DNA methylase
MKLIATTLQGLEDVLAKEIKAIGGSKIRMLKRAVLFEGSRYTLYAANLYLRTAIRILAPILEIKVKNEEDLYQKIKEIEWEKIFNTTQTFAVYGITSSPIFRHSKYVALKSKDAIADRFRERFNRRPSVDTQDPDLVVNIHIRNDRLTVSLDSSGKTLHMRGYRKISVDAPISENLAAGLLHLLNWDTDLPLYDPMCGSGTFLAEAYFLGKKLSPHPSEKHFLFKNWKDYSEELYQRVLEEFTQSDKEKNLSLYGSDIDRKAVDATNFNLQRIEGADIKVHMQDFFDSKKNFESGFMIINPPYDERLALEDSIEFYELIGKTLKQGYPGWTVGIVSGNLNAMKGMGLRPTKSYELKNGPIEVYFSIFKIYA